MVWTVKTPNIGTANSTNSILHNHSCVWKIRFKNHVISLSDFPSDAMLCFIEVETVESLEDLKSLPISFWKEFSKFRDAGREDCFCSEQDHPEIPFQEGGQSRGTESPERGSVSSRTTDRLHDLRVLPGYWRSWHRSWITPICSLCYSSWR